MALRETHRNSEADEAPIRRTGGWCVLAGRLAGMARLAIAAQSRNAETEIMLRRTCTGCCAA